MSFLGTLGKVVAGGVTGAVVTALPVFGAMGAISATGILVGSAVGAATVVDATSEEKKD